MAFSVPYLVNPARRVKLRTSKRRKIRRSGRKGGLPSGLLKKYTKMYGVGGKAMREAWREHKSGRSNPTHPHHRRKVVKHRVHHRKAVLKHRRRFTNPFGESVMIVGANPKRKSRKKGGVSTVARRRVHHRKRRVRRNPVVHHRVHHRRQYSMRHRVRHNPIRHYRVRHRRHYRRNPASSPSMSISRPMSLVMPAAMTAAGYFAANYIPTLLGSMTGSSAITRIGVKAALGIGSVMMLKSRAGMFLGAGALANALLDVVNTYVFSTTTTPVATSGFGAVMRRPLPRRPMSGYGAVTPFTVHLPQFPS